MRTVVAALLLANQPRLSAAAQAGDELFDTARVLQLKVEIPAAQLEALRKDPKTYAKGTVREGDKVYANVAVKLKGAASAQLLDKKPSLTIKFDEYDKSQSFHGHSRIVLDNAGHDPTYLSQALGGEIFRAAGVPAAKVTFARLELNGRSFGLYLLVQALNREFLADYFQKTKGNFYAGDNNDVTEVLRLESGSDPKNQADLKKLAAAAREGDPSGRIKSLATILDLDRFVSLLAAEVFTWHHKGYALGRASYRVYHDPVSERMVFLPEALGDLFTKADGPLVPACQGLVARGLLLASAEAPRPSAEQPPRLSPEGQRLYKERMTKLLSTAFKPETLLARMNELAGRIRPALAGDANELRAFEAAVARLRDTITQRARFLEEELKKRG
jgi:spore coat protein H